MYAIEGRDGKWRHWAAAIDEGYGDKPYIDLCISINKQHKKWKLRLSADNRELAAIANMLRDTAESIERNIKIYEGRRIP